MPSTIKALKGRRSKIDSTVDSAAGSGSKTKSPPKKNPYPPGSARAKLWARREADKRKAK